MKTKTDFAILAAEALGLILVFLLPLKFGAIIGLPSINLTYHTEILSVLLSPLPTPFFMLLSTVFLALALIAARGRIPGKNALIYVFLLDLLAVSAIPGATVSSTVNYAIQFLSYIFSLAAFGTGLSILFAENESIRNHFLAAFVTAFFFSLYSGFSQYLDGFQLTEEFIRKNHDLYQTGGSFSNEIMKRLQEHRVSGDFSSCNAYAGYLILSLPVAAAMLWRFGGRIEPAKIARPLLMLPITCAGLYLLYKTGSRGALLSLGAALITIILVLPLPKKWKLIPAALIPAGLAALTLLIILGRGAKSILFRLDYIQGAVRLMLKSPMTGTGWGGFQDAFFTVKMILDQEAPASPHNMMLSFGAESGIPAFLIAGAVLIYPLCISLKRLAVRNAKDCFSDDFLLETALLTGLLAWSFHAMQDILFETPSAMASALTVAVILLAWDRGSQPQRMRFPFLVCSCILLLAAGYTGWRYLRYDAAYSVLADTADIRLVPPQKLDQTSLSHVQNLYRKCEKCEPGSPYHDMIFSDFLYFKREPDAALEYLGKAISKNPGSAPLHAKKAKLLFLMGNPDEAKAENETARLLAPMNPKYQRQDYKK